MSWRPVTKDDFAATLSEKEIRVFGANDDASEAAIEQQLANVVSAVRGCVRSGRKCKMPDDDTLLPDMLVSPAMDLAAYNLIKRFNRVPNEARTKAYDHAQALMEKVATGAIVPEDYGETPSEVDVSSSLAKPAFNPKPRLLGRVEEAGI